MHSFQVKDVTAILDDADAHYARDWVWSVHRTGHSTYLRGYQRGIPLAQQKMRYLHRILTDAPRGKDVDHINGDGLDNRRENLRVCTRSQNNANRHRSQSRSSPFKGVHFEKCTGRWRAEVHLNGKRHTLGRFDAIEDAAAAYSAKATELFGAFANPSGPS
jgi:hypothetical protein